MVGRPCSPRSSCCRRRCSEGSEIGCERVWPREAAAEGHAPRDVVASRPRPAGQRRVRSKGSVGGLGPVRGGAPQRHTRGRRRWCAVCVVRVGVGGRRGRGGGGGIWRSGAIAGPRAAAGRRFHRRRVPRRLHPRPRRCPWPRALRRRELKCTVARPRSAGSLAGAGLVGCGGDGARARAGARRPRRRRGTARPRPPCVRRVVELLRKTRMGSRRAPCEAPDRTWAGPLPRARRPLESILGSRRGVFARLIPRSAWGPSSCCQDLNAGLSEPRRLYPPCRRRGLAPSRIHGLPGSRRRE